MSFVSERTSHALRVSAGAAITNVAMLFVTAIYFHHPAGVIFLPVSAAGPLYWTLLPLGIASSVIAVRKRYTRARIWLAVNLLTALSGAAIIFMLY